MLRPLTGTLCGDGRLGSHADDYERRFDSNLAARIIDVDVRGVGEARLPCQHLHVVARQLRLRHVDLGLDDVLHPEGKIRHGDLFLDPVVHPVNGLVVITREVDYGFPHGLAGNGAGVDANAADNFALFNKRDFLAALRRLNSRPLAGRTGADNDQIVALHSIPDIFLYIAPQPK